MCIQQSCPEIALWLVPQDQGTDISQSTAGGYQGFTASPPLEADVMRRPAKWRSFWQDVKTRSELINTILLGKQSVCSNTHTWAQLS